MRRSSLLLVLAALGLIVSSCQYDAVMWAACRPSASGDPTGTDGRYLLVCEDGVWTPVMTLDEYQRVRNGERTNIAPVPSRPPSTTTTTRPPSTTSTTTTTTTSTTTTTTSTTTTTVPDPYTTIDLLDVSGTVGVGCSNCADAYRTFTDANGRNLTIGFTISDTNHATDGGYAFIAFTYYVDGGELCRYPIAEARGRATIGATTYRMDIDALVPSGLSANTDLPGPWDRALGDLPTIYAESMRIDYDAPVCEPI